MKESQVRELASRFIRLAPEKRRMFLAALAKEGVDFSAFPIVASTGESARCLLSYAQQRMWFLWQLDPQSAAYNLPTATELNGPLNVEALGNALNAVIARHEILRTLFPTDDQGQPFQVISDNAAIEIIVEDIRSLSSGQDDETRALIERESLIPFDLVSGPLLRAKLFRLSPTRHILTITLHHIVADGWSINILIEELMQCYQAACAGTEPALPPLPIQYADYALWQRSWLEAGELQKQLDYWRRHLQGDQPMLPLPLDRSRFAPRDFVGARHEWQIDARLVDGLRALAAQHNASLFMVLLAAFQVLLHRYSGEPDIRVGVPVANRHRRETEGLIGCFINTQVMRADIGFQMTFADVLDSVRRHSLDAQANQDLPFEQLVDALQPERRLTDNPLFQVLFNHQALAADITGLTSFGDLQIRPFAWGRQTTQFDLKLDTWEVGGQLRAAFTYAPDVFDLATIEALARDWRLLLAAMVEAPATRIGDVDLLDKASSQHSLRDWNTAPNTTQSPPAGARLVHKLFEHWAALTPDACAVVATTVDDDGQAVATQLSYAALNTRANQLARHLQTLGVGPDIPVAIALERSTDLVVAILAVLKAGGAYVPLDPDYPEQRLRYMQRDSGIDILLTAKKLRERLAFAENTKVVTLDSATDEANWQRFDGTDLATSAVPGNLAYIIYTSGTTGEPKGVAVSHGNLCNYLLALDDALKLPATGNFAMVSTCAADLGHTVFYGALCGGGTLHLLQKEDTLDAERFAEYMERHAVAVIKMVPSHLQGLLLAHSGAALLPSQCLILGGETCPPALVQRVRALRPDCRIVNHYGPTETTVGVLTHAVEPDCAGADSIALGRPLAHCRAYVLDAGANPVPEKALGELFIGGAGLARGYCGKAAATAERFVPNPFSDAGGERLYRSGDRVRRNRDGDLVFRGRADGQIKIRGFRIEIAEIESQLRQLPGVADAAVVPLEGERGDMLLAAYVVPVAPVLLDATDEAKSDFCAGIKTSLLKILAEYMVPGHYHLLAGMPITANGKLDRKALPVIDSRDLQRRYRAPETPQQQQIAAVWQEVLGLERVGLDDNFFELGGHSLLITQVVSRLRRAFKTELPLRALFEAASLEDFCRTVATLVNGSEPAAREQIITPVPRDQPLPLSFAQTRQWLLWRMDPDSAAYNITLAFRIRGDLDIRALEQSFDYLMARHETWRTFFQENGDSTCQVIGAPQPFCLEPESVAVGIDPETILRALGREPFDLRRGPLLRVRLLQLGARDYLLAVIQHHVISDGWSMQVLANELADAYTAFRQGREPDLAPLPIQYADFAQWQRRYLDEAEKNRQLGYWRQRLGDDHAVLELPTDFPRPAQPSFAGADHTFTLPPALAQAIERRVRALGVTPFMWYLASFQLLLHRYSGRQQIRVGAPIANRTRLETEGLVGFFVNTLVHNAAITADMTVDGLLRETRRRALEAQAHQDLPFEQLVAALQSERSLSYSPLFQVMFNYQSSHGLVSGERLAALGGLELSEVFWDNQAAQFDLALVLTERSSGLSVTFNYATDLFLPETVERLASHWQRLLEAMVGLPAKPVSELPMLGADEWRRIVAEWNPPVEERREASTVVGLFEAQVESTPDARALVFPQQGGLPGQSLTYAGLNARANQLAWRLRELGVGPDVLVGVAVERGLDMVCAVLAILKAGGAYVPLDPAFPPERLAYMADNSRLALLLSQRAIAGALPLPDTIPRVFLDDTRSDYPTDNLSVPVHGQNLAYMIFTSGTTGLPKGVGIDQESLARHTQTYAGRLALDGSDCVLQYATLNFDTFGEQVFPTLCRGACVVLRGEEIWDHDTFHDNLIQHGISVANLTPSLWFHLIKDFADKGLRDFGRLRRMIVGGEAMPTEALNLWRQLGLCEQAELWNFYGPTEATAAATSFCCNRCFEGDAALPTTVPIGEPLRGRTVYIVGGDLNLLPGKAAGELVIGGGLLARGYQGRAALTAERFVPDPYDEQGGGRLYRSGDLARYRDDGQIEYQGRIDHQVKIRGFRIELGEIESQLQSQPEVKDAAVLAQPVGAGGQQLVAYVVPADRALAGADVDSEARNTFRAALKHRLQAALPDYMVPNQYVLLAELPLTPNGKLDRKALPAVDGCASQRAYAAPQSERELQLAAIWREVLGVERVGLDDNFFELGGDSIVAIQLVSRARQQGLRFKPKDVFQYQTLGALAAVAVPDDQTLQIDQGPVLGVLAPIPVQRWFFASPIPERHHWNQSLLLKPTGSLRAKPLRKALEQLLVHHDALRLGFAALPGSRTGWQGTFLPAQEGGNDLLWQQSVADPRALEALCNKAQRSLDLERGPLLRAVLAELPDGEQRLLLVIHHLVVDGVSWRILLEDLQTAYRQSLAGQPLSLPPKTSSVQVWSEQLHRYAQSDALQGELGYWQTELAGVAGDLPQDNPRGSLANRHTLHVTTRLDRTRTGQLLKDAPATYRTQINDLLLTALARVIARWTGRDSVLVQLEGHGREDLFEDIDLTRTVGWFTTLYPVKLSPSPALDASIKTIKEQLRAIPNKGLGYAVLRHLGAQSIQRQLGQLPEARITFNYLGQFDGSFEADDNLFTVAPENGGAEQSPEAPLGNWLTINGQVYQGELALGWSFSGEMYRPDTVQRLADAYTEELRALVEHCLRKENTAVTPSDFPLVELTQAQLDALPVAAAQIEDIYPLSPMQEGMLLHTIIDPHSGMYFMQGSFYIERAVDVELFRRAWSAVADLHDVLRVSFFWEGHDRPFQIVHKHASPELLRFMDWSGQSDAEHQTRLSEHLRRERETGFRLDAEPPFRITLIKLSDERFHCVVGHHHILMDAWCHSLIISDFIQFYQTLQSGAAIPPKTRLLFRDFIAWLEQKDNRESLAFWRNELRGFHQPNRLPFDRPVVAADSPSVVDELIVSLGQECSDRIKQLSAAHQLTANTFLQAAWALVLSAYSDRDDVLFGVTVAGRPADLPHLDAAVGLFINTIPLRIELPDLGRKVTTESWLKALLEKNLVLREHEHVPLVEVQACSEVEKGLPLFDSLFVYENAPFQEGTRKAASDMGVSRGGSRTHTNYPITVIVYPGPVINVGISYDQRYFDAPTIQQLLEDVKGATEALVGNLGNPVFELPVPGGEPVAESPSRSSGDAGTCPLTQGYARLFESRVEQHGDRIVARCAGEQWTYAELNQRANRLAHALITLTGVADTPIALLAGRGLPFLGMINGVFKAAAAYLPMDISHPVSRLAGILDRSGAGVLVCDENSRALAGEIVEALPADQRPEVLVWEEVQRRQTQTHNPGLPLSGRHLAYAIYTSGSTGTPKGVMVEQAGMLNNQLSKVPYLGLTEHDVIAQTAPPVFDISVWQFLAAGLCGARVEIVPDAIARDPVALLQQVNDSGITVLESVPALISGMLNDRHIDLPGLRYLMPTGEAMPPALARQWLERYPDIPLVNAYGPAECSDDVTLHRVQPADTGGVNLPIGEPVDNNRVFILNRSLAPMPWRAVGELYIAGTGVGRGYLADPRRTAETFVPNPFAGSPGERMYRSGDLVTRRYPDGVIEYIGRADHQVKIRGFRIELGEIEARLQAQAGIKDAAVLAQAVGGAGDRQLVAYLVPRDSALADAGADAETQSGFRADVKAHLQALLPDYMIPNQYVLLDRLPLTANGKLDRKALPEVDGSAFQRAYEAPRSELEQQLAAIWQEVLGVERIGLNDNFFELGGHSLLSIQLLNRIRRQGWQASVRDLFLRPQLGDFAQALAQSSGRARVVVPPNNIPENCRALTPDMVTLVDLKPEELAAIEAMVPSGAANIQDIYPLAPLQEGILFHHLLESGGDAYILLQAISFASREQLERFIASFNQVIARHDILRTAIAWEGLREPVQVVCRQAPLALHWLEADSGAAAIDQLRARVDKSHYRLDARRAPMIEAFALHDAERDRYLLQLANHHLISDHTTFEAIIREIGLIQEGREAELPEPQAFRQFVAQARLGVSDQEHEDFFTRLLGDVEEPCAPFGLVDVAGNGADIDEARWQLSAQQALALRRQAQRFGVSAASLFHLAWGVVVAKTSRREDAVFGTVLFGRMQGVEGAEQALGLFINTLPLRIALRDQSVAQALRQTHDTLAELMHHEHASLALAQRCCALPGGAPPGGAPLFSSLLNYRYSDRSVEANSRAAWHGMALLDSEERTNYPITLSVDDTGHGFTLHIQVSRVLDANQLCGYMVEVLDGLVAAMVAQPLRRALELPLFGGDTARRILLDWNATAIDYGDGACIHRVFEAQVDRTPDAVALVVPGRDAPPHQNLTYAALNAKANQLAHALREWGVGPDVPVGIAIERSLEMVVGLLAILKAGGAYVPLDPEYPEERLRYMVADSGIQILLTRTALRETLAAAADVRVVCLDQAGLWERNTADNLPLITARQNLAYVIYTSGSTGRPKGVSNTHEALHNRLAWMQDAYRLTEQDSVLQKTPFGFDVSVWEFFWPLCNGARLVMAGPGEHRDPERLLALIRQHEITTLHFVPSMLQVFMRHEGVAQCNCLRQIICSGEALSSALQNQVLQTLPATRLHNLYGPTEAAIDVTHWTCTDDGSATVPIGRPIANVRTYIQDGQCHAVPEGVFGELYLGGIGLARGYHHKPGLTAERFVPDPHAENSGGRLYRTGDLARYREDGNIEYLGRIDHQVKIRGLRIELGEIESQLLSRPSVKDAVVIAQALGAGGQQLVAYVVPADRAIAAEHGGDAQAHDAFRAELKTQLQTTLPEYMVPNQYVVLDQLPLTANGKLDRRALPAVDGSQFQRVYRAPQSALEQRLAAIWQEVLGVDRVGLDDNFFELGGHSLLMMRMITLAKDRLGIELPYRDYYTSGSIDELVRKIEGFAGNSAEQDLALIANALDELELFDV